MKKRYRILFIAVLMLLLWAGWAVSSSYHLPGKGQEVYHEKEWVLKDQNGSTERVSLPLDQPFMKGGHFTITSRIHYKPREGDAPYAFFSANHMYFRIYLDGRQIYSYTKKNAKDLSKSPGNVYAAVPLPQDCTGKEMSVEFWMTLEDGLVYKIDDVKFGDYPAVMRQVFMDNLSHNLLILATMVLGIILLILGIISGNQKYGAEIWYVGLFAVFFAIYSLSENKYNLYMIENPYFAYLVNFVVFAAIPVPLLLFFVDKVPKRFRKWYRIVLSLCGMNLAVQVCLHFLHIRDFRQMILCTHFVYAASFILIALSVCCMPEEERQGKRYILAGIIPVLAGLFLDGLIFYTHLAGAGRNTYFMQVGVLIFLMTEAIYVLKNILRANEESLRSESYKRLAFLDGLTEIYNRAAFREQLHIIAEAPTVYRGLICVCTDINNLKKVNDLLGHQAGDTLICKMSEFLTGFAGEDGSVYRIGGDEFIVLFFHVPKEKFQNKFDRIGQSVLEYNKDSEIELTFAMGYAVLEDGEDVENCVRRADEAMYMDKRRKKGIGHDIDKG